MRFEYLDSSASSITSKHLCYEDWRALLRELNPVVSKVRTSRCLRSLLMGNGV